MAVALALMASLLAGPSAFGSDEQSLLSAGKKAQEPRKGLFGRHHASSGMLGSRPPGVKPGTQGFGLGYHPGYGYGGAALGVGAEGGYPSYGGPGYPHPAPCLRRLGPETPFTYQGGSAPAQPNFYGEAGPLSADPPVVTFENESADPGYGAFTGVVPYPEEAFAPFTKATAEPTPAVAATPAPVPSSHAADPSTRLASDAARPAPARSLGIEVASASAPGLESGLKVTQVRPGSLAEQAGVIAGDVLLSINGYPLDRPAVLAKVDEDPAPEPIVRFRVRRADGQDQTRIARRP